MTQEENADKTDASGQSNQYESDLALRGVDNSLSSMDNGDSNANAGESAASDSGSSATWSSKSGKTSSSVNSSAKSGQTSTASAKEDGADSTSTTAKKKTTESEMIDASSSDVTQTDSQSVGGPSSSVPSKSPKVAMAPPVGGANPLKALSTIKKPKLPWSRYGAAPKKKPKDDVDHYLLCWPDSIATLKESEAFYDERDGSLYIAKIIEKFPNLLVMVFGSEVDHLQRQPDHPHIALNYNAWLSNKARWVRLNPDMFYMAQVGLMNKGNFKNNPPRSPIDASEINLFLESEGVVPDYVYMQGCIAELADRKRTKNLKGNLTDVLVPYTNGAAPPPVTKKNANATGSAEPKKQ